MTSLAPGSVTYTLMNSSGRRVLGWRHVTALPLLLSIFASVWALSGLCVYLCSLAI